MPYNYTLFISIKNNIFNKWIKLKICNHYNSVIKKGLVTNDKKRIMGYV